MINRQFQFVRRRVFLASELNIGCVAIRLYNAAVLTTIIIGSTIIVTYCQTKMERNNITCKPTLLIQRIFSLRANDVRILLFGTHNAIMIAAGSCRLLARLRSTFAELFLESRLQAT